MKKFCAPPSAVKDCDKYISSCSKNTWTTENWFFVLLLESLCEPMRINDDESEVEAADSFRLTHETDHLY